MNSIQVANNEFIPITEVAKVKFREVAETETKRDHYWMENVQRPTGGKVLVADITTRDNKTYHIHGEQAEELRRCWTSGA
jgi:hypothetical protein